MTYETTSGFLLQTVVAVVLATLITSLASVWFHGAVGLDFVSTGIVAALIINTLVGVLNRRWRAVNAALEARIVARTAELELARAAAAVAHEVKNPLTALLGNLELATELLASPRTPEVEEALATSVRGAFLASKHLERLVVDLREPTSTLAADLGLAVEEAAQLARPHVAAVGTLELQVAPGLTAAVPRSRLVQVVLNLLVNAANASRPGVPNAIVVRAAPTTGGVQLTVEDHGVGMEPEVLARVFEPGFTTHAATGGSGLGLPIVRGIVHGLGGTIHFTSTPGRGSTAVVLLPEPTPR